MPSECRCLYTFRDSGETTEVPRAVHRGSFCQDLTGLKLGAKGDKIMLFTSYTIS